MKEGQQASKAGGSDFASRKSGGAEVKRERIKQNLYLAEVLGRG